MPKFNEIANCFNQKHFNETMKTLFEKHSDYLLSEITDLLYFEGISGNGTFLKTDKSESGKYYSNRTIVIKKEKGQPTDRVTLKDTGKFYKSYRFTPTLFGFEISANIKKENGTIFRNFKNQFGSYQKFYNAVTSIRWFELKKILDNKILPEFKEKIL